MRALLLGRFQPLHLGHLKVISDIVKESEYIVIAIGSAQYSHALENPFTAGERHTMIARTLKARGIEGHHIVGIEDIHRYAVWVAHVVSQTPNFDVVYAHNPLSVRLFSEAGPHLKDTNRLIPQPQQVHQYKIQMRRQHGAQAFVFIEPVDL